ncbi:MAG: DUF421 domain-containing protein [Clostridia bacterium]|nr:DUF421 domain-containing protein [Clostridia bacterium]
MAITALRTIIIYVVLIAAMRIMGRRQLGELQPIELVVTLLISDLASIPIQENGIPLLNGLIPIFILVAAEILLSAWMLKSPGISRLISGNPMVLIHKGHLDQKVLKKLRLSVEDLTEGLRQQNVFDLRDVQTAIAETNGKITVYPVIAKRALVREDLGGDLPPDHGMPLVVFADGQCCDWAMQACDITEQDVLDALQRQHHQKEAVLMVTADAAGHYTIIPKEAIQ